jgi:hypothetical protein
MNGTNIFRICALAGALASAPAFAQADNTNSKVDPAMSTWMSSHQGRISRQEYMDEVGRRWDRMDTNRQGLTYDEIRMGYGYGSGAPTPNRVKKGNNMTNPTGTEPKGQNSGGK